MFAGMNILDLSDELLLQIFSFLLRLGLTVSHVILVCMRLYSVGLPLLYRNLGRRRYLLTQKALTQLVQTINRDPERGSCVESGSFHCYEDDLEPNMLELLSKCPGVKSISLRLESRPVEPQPVAPHEALARQCSRPFWPN